MQTAIIFRNVDNDVTTFSTTPNKTSHSVLVVAIPDVLPLHVTPEGHIAVYVGKEKKLLDDILSTDQDSVEARPYVTWKEESGTYSLPLKITWDGNKQEG